MKKFKWMALLAALSTATLQANAAPERIGDFNLIDHTGIGHQLSKMAYLDAVVFISQSNACSINQALFSEYRILQTKWDDQNIGFYMINSSTEDSPETIRRYDASYNVNMPILVDDNQLVAEELGITKAGEIVIVDPTSREILFRGPMDKSMRADGETTTDMIDTLTAVAEDETDAIEETRVVEYDAPADCNVEFPAKMAHMNDVPDYETEVAPILIERCVVCHIEGGIGPFAMNSYQMIQGWSPMIKEVLMTKRMPPAQVDPSIRGFENARNMPIEETQTLIHWINAGAPRE
ncbi:MAG: hypothetical protein R3332_14165 [Pseudohongiellaceae bacterium]|nr:hypothetical protein [Pseudohongiellaceae bacterium]